MHAIGDMPPSDHERTIPGKAIRFYDDGTLSGSLKGGCRYHGNDVEVVHMGMEEWAKPIAAAIAFLAGAIATGWAQSRIGTAGAGTLAEKPETAGILIIMEAIPETMTILGFVVACMIILM